MPLINVIPGEKIPTAPLNTRLPVWRVPGWLLLFVWLARGTARSVVLAVRYWWITGPDRRRLDLGDARVEGHSRRRPGPCCRGLPLVAPAPVDLAPLRLVSGRWPRPQALGLPARMDRRYDGLRPRRRAWRWPLGSQPAHGAVEQVG